MNQSVIILLSSIANYEKCDLTLFFYNNNADTKPFSEWMNNIKRII